MGVSTPTPYIWEDLCMLYANTTPLYITDLSICEFWNLQGSWNQCPKDTERGCSLLSLSNHVWVKSAIHDSHPRLPKIPALPSLRPMGDTGDWSCPLLNSSGEVIGINQSIYNPDNNISNIGIGFATPVNLIREYLLGADTNWFYISKGSFSL